MATVYIYRVATRVADLLRKALVGSGCVSNSFMMTVSDPRSLIFERYLNLEEALQVITVVSGLPRSGTSLMMQMIVAGGIPALTDGLRSADDNNPKGYFEWEPAKSLKQHPEAIADGEGKAVKIISALLAHLPATFEYRVLFMVRPLEEVISSQNRMLERMGKEVPKAPTASVVAAFQKHLKEIEGWLQGQPHLMLLRVQHADVLARPREESERIASFLGRPMDVDAMARQVERSLYRERSAASPVSP